MPGAVGSMRSVLLLLLLLLLLLQFRFGMVIKSMLCGYKGIQVRHPPHACCCCCCGGGGGGGGGGSCCCCALTVAGYCSC